VLACRVGSEAVEATADMPEADVLNNNITAAVITKPRESRRLRFIRHLERRCLAGIGEILYSTLELPDNVITINPIINTGQ
jgi:hypothetical protein